MVVFLGLTGAGKTSLVGRYAQDQCMMMDSVESSLQDPSVGCKAGKKFTRSSLLLSNNAFPLSTSPNGSRTNYFGFYP